MYDPYRPRPVFWQLVFVDVCLCLILFVLLLVAFCLNIL